MNRPIRRLSSSVKLFMGSHSLQDGSVPAPLRHCLSSEVSVEPEFVTRLVNGYEIGRKFSRKVMEIRIL